jgi:beta-lactamase regulating signal transducer with metallopeptidase domain
MTVLFDSALKVSVVLAVALFAAALCRRRSPALRHWILSAAVLCSTALPFAAWVLPVWNLTPAKTIPAFSGAPGSQGVTNALGAVPAREATTMSRIDPEQGIAMVWLAGSGMALVFLFVGFVRLLRVAWTCERVTQGDWVRIADVVSQRYGLNRRVRLLRSRSSSMLVTWGTLRPTVLLPQGSEFWDEERIRVVLHHELAHVRRNDWLLHTVAEMLRVAYWFNPLMWIVCRRLRLESECAADNAVLAHGISASQYAVHLLKIVRELHQPDHSWSAASAMARPSTLERRFSAMLNNDADRRPTGWLAMAAVAMLLLSVSLPVAALSTSAPPPVVVWEVWPAPVVPPPAARAQVPQIAATAPARVQQAPVPVLSPPAAPRPAYTGEPISLDLSNTDIKDFFRLIRDLSGLTVVLDPDVKGSITITLTDIPWDQALDIVMKTYNLGAVLEGNVMRISSRLIVLDFEVFKNGAPLGRSRIGTIDRAGATLSQGTDYTISATPIKDSTANKIELIFAFVVGAEKFAARLPAVSKDLPGNVTWKTAAGSYEVRINLVTP